MKHLMLLLFILATISSSNAQSAFDTVKVHFPINIARLDSAAKNQVNTIITQIGTKKILIYGYADYLGNESTNLELAEQRAKNVKAELLNRGLKKEQIQICTGIGTIYRTVQKSKDGYPEDRKVAIFIKREITTSKAIEAENPTSSSPKKGRVKVHEIANDGRLFEQVRKTDASTNGPLTNKVGHPNKQNTTNAPKSSRFEALSELKANEVMRIENLQFQPTRHYLMKESEPILQELLQTLQDNPELAINIEGHVCCMKGDGDALDTDTYELKLSENRAKYIYQYLVDNGIEASRLGYIGFGKKRPIVANEQSEEDAQKNRRVEIRVLRN